VIKKWIECNYEGFEDVTNIICICENLTPNLPCFCYIFSQVKGLLKGAIKIPNNSNRLLSKLICDSTKCWFSILKRLVAPLQVMDYPPPRHEW